MKKRNQLLALCALVILVLTVFACENPFIPGKYKEPSPPQAPTVSVEASPIGPYVKGEGVTVTAKASVGDGGELSYQWYSNTKNSNSGGTKISGATGESYRPSTDIEDTSILIDSTYYYVQVTNTLYGRTTPASSRTVDVTAYDTEGRTAIRDASVTVNIPVEGDVPSQTAFIGGSGYACTGIAWAPQHNPFRGNIKYTARITLEALSEHTLIALRSATVNGQAVSFRYDPYDSGKDEVELEYTFSEVKTVTEIAVQSPMTKLAYTHGDELNLSGLVVRMTYNTGETEDVALSSFASRNITTNPAHGAELSYTIHNGTHVVVSYAGLNVNTANLTVNKAVISTATIAVTPPSMSAVANTTATVDSNENYTSSAVTWTPAPVGNQFQGSTAYTARVTLTAGADYVFANNLTAKMDVFNAVVSNNSGTTAVISHQFAQTLAKEASSIAVTSQPTKLGGYIHGDTLDLAGLVVTVTFNDTSTQVIPLAEFGDYNITTAPLNNAVLHRSANNGQGVNVRLGGYSANTNALSITQKPITITGARHTKQYDGNTNASSISDVTNLTFSGNLETVTHGPATAVYTNFAVGTTTINISALNLTGDSNTNYTVTIPANNVQLTGIGDIGITKKTITVSGATHTKEYDGSPTAAGVTNVTFSGVVAADVGNVTATGVTAVYTSSNAGTQTINITALTLSGSAAGNYTVDPASLNNVPVAGITKITPTVSVWPTASNVNSGSALSTSTLSGGTASVGGTYAWRYPDTIMTNVGPDNQQDVIFTPTSGNYNQVTGSGVFVTVNPKVTFVLNSGTLNGSTNDYIIHGTYNGTVTRPTNPTRSTYTFDTWYTNSTLTTPYNFSTTVTSDRTLYAKWVLTSNITTKEGLTLNATNMPMVWVAGGTFPMGKSGQPTGNTLGLSPFDDITPVHDVTLNGFYIGKYEVTQEQFQNVMGTNPSSNSSSPVSGEVQTKRPVEFLTWFDAVEFCNKLSVAQGLTEVYNIASRTPASGYPITNATVTATWTNNGYRLPTEAEWEYAARGGVDTHGYLFAGTTDNNLQSYIWGVHSGLTTNANGSTSNSYDRSHEVGKKLPNELSIYDMSGNVSEWCWDYYAAYPSEAQTNPHRDTQYSTIYRIYRGGDYRGNGTGIGIGGNSWMQSNIISRAYSNLINLRNNYTGFRVARNAD